MRTCPYCQRELPPDATVCPYTACGQRLDGGATPGPSVPPKRPPPMQRPLGGVPPAGAPASVPVAPAASPNADGGTETSPPPLPPEPLPSVASSTPAPIITTAATVGQPGRASLDEADPELRVQADAIGRQVRAGRRRSRFLSYGTIAAICIGLLCFGLFYAKVVFCHATLKSTPEIRRNPHDRDRLTIVYHPTSRGILGFGRVDGDRKTELLDLVTSDTVGSDQEFEWRVSGVRPGDKIWVKYFDGLWTTTKELKVPKASAGPRSGDGILAGQVVDATSNQPLADAEVRVLGTTLKTWTDAEGMYQLDGVPAGSVPIRVSAAGFSTDEFDRDVTALEETPVRVALSPGMEAGQMRIVLTWGERPEDLDAHLKGPLPDGRQFHVYYHDTGDIKTREHVSLDVDDRNGQGPETLTVLGVQPGIYDYYVLDYSNREDPRSRQLARSGAEVKVYQGGQTYRFRAGHDSRGNLWNVCRIEVKSDGSAVVEEIDTYESQAAEELVRNFGLYDKRTQADRVEWIPQYGGSRESETAVGEGLSWLARHQAPDGSWSHRCLSTEKPEGQCEHDPPCPDPGEVYEMAHTGLALLAFQAGGHYDFNDNVYSGNVRRGLDWMVAHQQKDGALIGSRAPGLGRPLHDRFMYEHGIAAFALAEACAVAYAQGRPVESRYRAAAEKAIRFIENQQHDDGGWKYTVRLQERSDTSVSGWQVLALKTAKEANIPVKRACIEKIRRFYDANRAPENGRTRYQDHGVETEATTGMGMLVRQFLLEEPDAPLIQLAASFLADEAEKRWAGGVAPWPDLGANAKGNEKDFYLWYNCTLAMYQAGGTFWERWNGVIRDAVIGLQRHDGCMRGSWDPDSRWGNTGGRIYSTALAILTLEVYYRYAALEALADADEETPEP